MLLLKMFESQINNEWIEDSPSMIPDHHFIDAILCILKGLIETFDDQPKGEMFRERYFPPTAIKINNEYY